MNPSSLVPRFAFLRLVLLATCWYGAYVAVGGRITVAEAGLMVACILMNFARLWLGGLSQGRLGGVIWATLFIAAPLAYFLLRTNGQVSLSFVPQESIGLGPLVIAMAMPFQVFATFHPGMPKSQHLTTIFVLVETVLAAKEGQPEPLFLHIALLLTLTTLAMILSGMVEGTDDSGRLRRWKTGWIERLGLAAMTLRSMSLFLVAALILLFTLPRADDDLANGGRHIGRTPDQGAAGGGLGGAGGDSGAGLPEGNEPRMTLSGLGGQVEIGRLSEIIRARHAVAEVSLRPMAGQQIPSSFLRQPLFHLRSFDRFDGVRWSSSSDSPRQGIGAIDQDPVLVQSHWELQPPVNDSNRFVPAEMQVSMIAPSPEVMPELFLTGWPVQLSGTEGNFEGTERQVVYAPFDNHTLILASGGEYTMERYRGIVLVPDADAFPQNLEAGANHSARFDERSLLPDSIYESIQSRWQPSEQARFDIYREDPLQLAAALEDWFVTDTSFKYSLSKRPRGALAIADFICVPDERSGHCEVYATAMAVLMRFWGYEARVAMGYAPEPLPAKPAKEYLWKIDSSQSHAWVEVYDPTYGWVTFDPTPPDRQLAPQPDAVAADAAADQRNEAFDWSAAWLAFDTWGRSAMVDEVKATLAGGWRAVRGALAKHWWWVALVGFGALVLWLRLRRIRRTRPSHEAASVKASFPRAEVPLLTTLQELLAELARHGLRRGRGMTLQELVAAAPPMIADRIDVPSLAASYYRERYGGMEQNTEVVLKQAIERLRQTDTPSLSDPD